MTSYLSLGPLSLPLYKNSKHDFKKMSSLNFRPVYLNTSTPKAKIICTNIALG